MKETILVTGGAGYIGSILVPELLKSGYKVTVLDNFMYKQNSLIDCAPNDDFDIINSDARDENLLKKLLKNVDFIIPLAALVGVPLCSRDTIGAQTVNRDAVKSIVKFASKNQGIIFPTTNSGYGIGLKNVYCTEKSPLRPITLYAKLKMEAEKSVLDRGNSISFRLATAFGLSPRMRIDLLVNDFTYRAVKDHFIVIFEGHFRRNYVHIRDIASAFVHAIKNFDRMKNEAYNIGLSDANLSKIELCRKIRHPALGDYL